MEWMTAREGTIASRRTAARLCTVLGVAALVAAVVLALVPGSPSCRRPASCGSLLAPMYPPGEGVGCAAAQVAWFPVVAAAALAGLLLLGAGAAVVPSRRTRRRR
jgi:hypothetical protein